MHHYCVHTHTPVSHWKRGFSLLELSIVMAIIGTILAGAIAIGLGGIEASRYNATVKRMDEIHNSILAYSMVFGRLPCPSDLTLTSTNANFGVEAANKGTCTGGTPAANFTAASGTVEGGLPTRTLKFTDDYQFDAWGRRLRYAVNPEKTSDDSLHVVACSTSTKVITVKDAAAGDRSTNSVYALISHGANGHGAYSFNGVVFNAGSTNTDEQINCHCDASAAPTAYSPTYVQKLPTTNSSTATDSFDDIATYREAWQLQNFANPLSSVECAYIYVVDRDNNRIQKFDLDGNYVSQFGSAGSGNGQFNNPVRVHADSSGNIWVTDQGNSRIQKFDSSGTYVSQISAGGYTLVGIDIDSSGNVWAINYWGNILKYNSSGTLVGTYGTWATTDGNFQSGMAVAIDTDDNVWVGNQYDTRIQKFNNSGAFVSKFMASAEWGEGMAFNTDSSVLWISGTWAGTVRRFNTSGTLLSTAATYASGCPTADGVMNNPRDVAVDEDGNAYVTDSACNVVHKFDSSGNYVTRFGSSGSGNGQFSNPNGIAITSR